MPHMIKKNLKPALAHFQGCRSVCLRRIKMTTRKLVNDRNASILVERCRTLIRLKITGYFEDVLQKVPLQRNWLTEARGFSQANSGYGLLSSSELMAIIDNVQQSIERETEVFITKPILLPGSETVRRLELYSELPIQLLQAYRETLQISRYTEIITNKAWEHGYNALRCPSLIEMAMEHLSLGTKFLELINCSARQQQRRCQAEISKQIAGRLEFIRDQLIAELCSNVARMIYDQYDAYMVNYRAKTYREIVLPMLIHDQGTDAASQKKAV